MTMMIINSGPGGGSLRLLPQSQTSPGLTLGFPFPSPISFLSLPASPPRPTLHAEPGPVVRPGEKVLLWCRSPSSSHNRFVTFLLLKAGTQELLQKNQESVPLTFFPLESLSAQESRSYSCVYYYTSHPHVRSEASETLEVWVTDSLPKPSLSARPSSKVTSGDNVTLLCQGPSRGVEFALYKDGAELPVSTSEPTQHGAEFPLIHVNINQTGRYRCSYLLGRDSRVLTMPSDPLELIIQGEGWMPESPSEEIKTILITALSCAFILFLLFFFTFRGHCHTETVSSSVKVGANQKSSLRCLPALSHKLVADLDLPLSLSSVISHGDTSRRCLCCTWFVCFSSKSGAPQHETEYARVAKCSCSRTSVPEVEDPEELIYIQLNPALKKQRTAPGKMCPDPTTYATLALQ
ncbi:leukocyte immunoglobulin-like receptor subfamily A member 2 [Sarcophilus harrisii]|uniref:leukocyte immunoglobulin-like receptor subfamily A member 2 n=1 Tax=Sarcophilus harrisii TaxID=9305 RepID=UPI001301C6ED|nr:leukocyte immunoglobulin-like receptor subfamily A member 2 [Sarcophilus harrisii]